jgi:hypothetical protein
LEKKCLYRLNLLLKEISYNKLAPQLQNWRRLNPNRNGDCASGMRVLASSCGDTYEDLTLLGLKWALTLKWNAFPSKSSKAKVRKRTKINKNIQHGSRSAQVRNSG